jgi:hypothetical protein
MKPANTFVWQAWFSCIAFAVGHDPSRFTELLITFQSRAGQRHKSFLFAALGLVIVDPV